MESVENLENRSSTIETEKSKREYWERCGERIANIGLIHYPVPAREILSRLREVGYYVGSYSHLSHKEQKDLLEQKRQEIRGRLAKYLPAVLKSIDQRDSKEYNRYSRNRGHTQRR